MAQKVAGYIKLQIPAGKATPGTTGWSCSRSARRKHYGSSAKEFNEKTAKDAWSNYPCSYYSICRQIYSHSSQRHHRQQFLSRRLARSKAGFRCS